MNLSHHGYIRACVVYRRVAIYHLACIQTPKKVELEVKKSVMKKGAMKMRKKIIVDQIFPM